VPDCAEVHVLPSDDVRIVPRSPTATKTLLPKVTPKNVIGLRTCHDSGTFAAVAEKGRIIDIVTISKTNISLALLMFDNFIAVCFLF
jgi:hypothetical protein